METTSDVRYSVLKEKFSEMDQTIWRPDNLNESEIKLNNFSSSPDKVVRKNSSKFSISKNLKSTSDELDNSDDFTEDMIISSPHLIKDKSYIEIVIKDDSSSMRTTTTSATNTLNTINNLSRNNSDKTQRNNVRKNNLRSSSSNNNNNNQDDLELNSLPSIEFSSRDNSNLNKLKINYARTYLEKFLFFIIIALLIIILVLCLSLFKNNPNDDLIDINKNKTKTLPTCTSDKCLLVAVSIYKSLNDKVDPCDDFYEYSCGGWTKRNLIPSGFPRWGTLSLITYENQLIIKDQLESNITYPDITEAEMKAKMFYHSCMDTHELIEKLGAKPLMDILNRFMYKDSNNILVINETFNNLITTIQIDYGLNVLFELNVLDDDKNSSYSNIEIIQGSLGLDRSFYINNASEKNSNTMEIYKKTILNVYTMLFGKIDNLNEEMENLIEFETRLAKIMLPTQNLSNVESVYSRIKLKDLNSKYATFLDWIFFLNKYLKDYGSPEILYNEDEIIVIASNYFEQLSDLIKEYSSEPKKEKVIKMTVIFHLIKFSLPLLSKEYRNQYSAIGEALTGANSVERWQTCIERADNIFGLGFAISRMFIRKSPNNAKQAAQTIIKTIKESFINNFPKITWMDDETRRLAEEKVNSVDDLIGYPDFIQDDKSLNERYAELNITEDDYFGNEIRLVQYSLKSEVVTYRTLVNRSEWEMTSSAVNAYYSPTRNQIVFPSGILQEPFFHPENPMSINYGSIGSVMGHELTHGFDDSGREYDKYGMMHQWWNNKTIEDFKEASECMAEQYSKFMIENEYLNGRQTLGENIADNGGLNAAYNAYQKWIEKNGEENPLPLLKLTHRQLFYISFAQTWCSKSTSDSVHLSLSVDQHSPPKFRVIGSVSNSVEFSKAFNCPKDSKMNPDKKCILW